MSIEPLRFALLGHPLGHSLSPAIHGSAYAELGLPHRYELCDVPDAEAVRSALARLRDGHFAGLNVTVPWKRLALQLADEVDALAAEVGAANVLTRSANGALRAYNTDVLALADELSRSAPALRSALVIGNGGAALAAVAALKKQGASRCVVTARAFGATNPASSWPHAEQFRALGAQTLAWPGAGADGAAWTACIRESHAIVQATSAGMHGVDTGETLAALVPWDAAAAGTLAYDVVYNPSETPFLREARQHGLVAVGGLGMLVGQAAHAFEIWLGVRAPRPVMHRAAEQVLASRAAR
jgi:shikimate dehydrogenase